MGHRRRLARTSRIAGGGKGRLMGYYLLEEPSLMNGQVTAGRERAQCLECIRGEFARVEAETARGFDR